MRTEPKIQECSTPPDAAALRRSIGYHLRYSTGKSPAAATLTDWRLRSRGRSAIS